VGNSEYGVTLDHVHLSGQRKIGLQNTGNAVAAADLITDAPTPVANTAPGGLVVLADAVLRTGPGDTSPRDAPISGVFHGAQCRNFLLASDKSWQTARRRQTTPLLAG
jgi:hypothetical protein